MPRGRKAGFNQRHDKDVDANRKQLTQTEMTSGSSSDVSSGEESSDEQAENPKVPARSVRCSARQAATKAAAFIAAAALELEESLPKSALRTHRDHCARCSICNITFDSVEDLERHQEVHEDDAIPFRQFRCKECKKIFKYKKCIKKHILREHNVPSTKYLIEFLSPSSNEVLGGKWKTLSQSEEENQETSNQESGLIGQPQVLISQPQAAESTFIDIKELQLRDSLLSRTCQLCRKICSKPSDLQRHMMKHTGERPFECSVCGRRFKSKRSMQYHLRSAHGAMVELSPALEDKLTSTQKYKRNARKHDLGMDEWSQPPSENVSTDNSQSEVIRQVKEDGKASLLSGSDFPVKHGVFIKTEHEDAFDDAHEETDELNTSRSTMEDGNSKEHSYNDYSCDTAEEDKITGVAVLQQTILTESSESHPMYTDSLNRGHLIGDNYDDEDDDDDEDESHVYSIASLKAPNDGKPNVVKYKVNPCSEEILVTRMVGANITNGEKAYLYKCHWCAKVFLSLSKLQNHLSAHLRLSQKTFNCSICGEIFQQKSLLQLHSKEHSKSPNRSNSHVDSDEEQQMMDHDGMTGMAETGEVPVKIKLETEQSDSDEQNESNEDPDDALPRFFSPEELSQMVSAPLSVAIDSDNMPIASGSEGHLSPSTDADSMPPLEVSINGARVGYRCHYCEKIFDRLFSLNRHERVHTGIKACYCKECGRGFSEPRNLRHHMIRFHSDGSQRHLLRRSIAQPTSSRRARGRRRSSSISKPILGATRSSYLRKMAYLNAGVFSEYANLIATRKTIILPELSDQKGECADSNGTNPKATSGQNDLKGMIHKNVAEAHPTELIGITKSDKTKVILSTDTLVRSKTVIDANDGIRAEVDLPQNDCEILSNPKRSPKGILRKQKSNRGNAVLDESTPLSADRVSNVSNKSSSPLPPFIPHTASPPTTSMLAPPTGQSIHSIKEVYVCTPSLDSELPESSDAFNRATLNNAKPPTFATATMELPRRPSPIILRKQRTRGNNKYFSTYSPRLHQVEIPAGRADACRPQVLPDGKSFYECSYCHKAFASVSDVNRHMDFHEDVRPYKCKFCNYCSRTNSQLKVHMMRHQGIKQYLCEMCKYCGVTQSDLKRHNRSQGHIFRSRNVCHLCGLGHVTRQQRTAHMLSCHRGITIPAAEIDSENLEQLVENERLEDSVEMDDTHLDADDQCGELDKNETFHDNDVEKGNSETENENISSSEDEIQCDKRAFEKRNGKSALSKKAEDSTRKKNVSTSSDQVSRGERKKLRRSWRLVGASFEH